MRNIGNLLILVAGLFLCATCASCVFHAPPACIKCAGETAVPKESSLEQQRAALDKNADVWFKKLVGRLPPAATVYIWERSEIEAYLYKPTLDAIAVDQPGWEARAAKFLIEIPHDLGGSLDYMPTKVLHFKMELAVYLFDRVGCPGSLDKAVAAKLSVGSWIGPVYLAMREFPWWSATHKVARAGIKSWIAAPDSMGVLFWLSRTASIEYYATELLPYVKRIAALKNMHPDGEFSDLSAWLSNSDHSADHWREEFRKQVIGTPYKGRFNKD